MKKPSKETELDITRLVMGRLVAMPHKPHVAKKAKKKKSAKGAK